MDLQQLKDDAAAGRVSVETLIDVIVVEQQVIAAQQERIAELEALIKGKNPTTRTEEPYSERAEAKRKQTKKSRKRKPLRRGRVSTAEKIKLAARTEQIYPEGVEPNDCRLSHTRVVWRLEDPGPRGALVPPRVADPTVPYRDRVGPGLDRLLSARTGPAAHPLRLA